MTLCLDGIQTVRFVENVDLLVVVFACLTAILVHVIKSRAEFQDQRRTVVLL
jgi:hypothetical protein